MQNTTLLDTAQSIMATTAPAQFQIQAQFLNASSGSTFSWFPFRIEGVSIVQDFIHKYGDVMTMVLKISPKDYALLQDQGQNLLCTMTITYVDPYFRTVYTPAAIQKQYHVIIQNPQDIRAKTSDLHAYTEPSMTMTVQLVEPTLYALRQTKLNKVYQKCTVTQAIQDLTQCFGITNLHLTPSDNTHVYDHIDIGSYQGIASVYDYLNRKFGVHIKGSNSYFTKDVLYVYPPFETAPVYDKTVLFYQVDQGRYAGCHAYHKQVGSSVSVVVNTQPNVKDLSIVGAENVGTGFVMARASRMVDGYTAIDSKTGAAFTNNPALTISLNNGRTASAGLNNLKHIRATDNPFPEMAELISHQASLMQMTWMNADPFLLDPGHAVAYHYDRNSVMMKKTGIVEFAQYDIVNVKRVDTRDVFSANATLLLRLAPNDSMVL